MKSLVRMLPLLLSLALPLVAQVDRVTLTDGTDVGGAITSLWAEGVVVTTSEGGEELVPWRRVAFVTSGAPVSVDFGGNRVVGLVVAHRPGQDVSLDTGIVGVLRVPLGALASRPAPEPATEEAGPSGPSTPLEPEEWNGGAALFSSVTRGNAEVFDLSFEINAARQWTHDRIELSAFAVRGVAEGETNKDAQRARGLWRHHYSDDFYSYASLEIGRDSIQQVSIRMLANVGAGYNIWRESDDELLSIEGGVGYRLERFENNGAGRDDATGRVALIYKDVFWEKGIYDQLFEVIVPFNEPNAILGRFEAGLSLPIAENWNLRNSLRVSYRGEAPRGTNAFDVYLGVGVEYTF